MPATTSAPVGPEQALVWPLSFAVVLRTEPVPPNFTVTVLYAVDPHRHRIRPEPGGERRGEGREMDGERCTNLDAFCMVQIVMGSE